MTTGLDYSTYITQVAQLAVVPEDDPNFVAIAPMMITYSENRIFRDLDFLQTVTTLTSRITTASDNTVILGSDADTPDFVVVQEINVITPAGTTNPLLGTTVPLLPTTKEFLRWVYPSAASKATPIYFAPLTQAKFLLGPWPDAAYTLQTVGTIRPASLSSTNDTTFISLYLPDLLVMASMVYISAFQRNFGNVAANDAAMPGGYEGQYKGLLTPAAVEEARKKFQSGAWSSMSPAVAATPTR